MLSLIENRFSKFLIRRLLIAGNFFILNVKRNLWHSCTLGILVRHNNKDRFYSRGKFYWEEDTRWEISLFLILIQMSTALIPMLLKRLNPKLRNRDYLRLKNDPGYREKLAIVCQNCYLLMTENSKYNNSLPQIKLKGKIEDPDFFGTRFLDPASNTIIARVIPYLYLFRTRNWVLPHSHTSL